MIVCKLCEESKEKYKKLPRQLLVFLQVKIPVKAEDLICKNCYALLKKKYQAMQEYQKHKKLGSILSSTNGSNSIGYSSNQKLLHSTVSEGEIADILNTENRSAGPLGFNNETIQPYPVVPSKVAAFEEVDYEVSDEDNIDPAIPLPNVQPLIKRRKVVRPLNEPKNWRYQSGG